MTFFLINLFLLTIIVIELQGRIHIRTTKTFDWIWDDHDTGSTDDASIWIPHLISDNEYYITMHAGRGHDGPDEVAIVITKAPEGVLKKPQAFGWKKTWSDIGSGGTHNVLFIQPKPEPGYICFGSYIHVSENYDNPGDPAIYIETWHKYRCVHEKWVHIINDKKDHSQWIWNDHGSGADDDGTIFKINVKGFPYHYYRTDVGHPSSFPGPYYELIPYIHECNVKDIELNNNELTKDQFFGAKLISNVKDSIDITNDKYIPKEVTLLQNQRCITTSTYFTYTNGYESSISMKYSFEHTNLNDEIQKISLSAKEEQQWHNTNMKEIKSCTTKNDEKFLCPPRSICRSKYFELKPIARSIPLKITLMCGVNKNIEKVTYGIFKSKGSLKYLVQKKITPMDCDHYSANINDINFGKLPFCDRCDSNNKCLKCRDHMVLTNGICVPDKICVDDCKGSIKGFVRDSSTNKKVPYFSGAYCKNEQINLKKCYESLYPEFKCSKNSYLYSNNNKLNDIKNNCGLDGNCNNRLFDGTINDCYNRCLNHPQCKSYTFKRIINNNVYNTICNIYDIIQPNNYVDGGQKMCIMK